MTALRSVAVTLLLAGIYPSTALAADIPVEIDYLLTAIGGSECTFIRNGSEHSAEDAEKHLRTKYRRAKRYASTTEKFIDNLASRSSMSRKPYMIECEGKPAVETGTWLKAKLDTYRTSNP